MNNYTYINIINDYDHIDSFHEGLSAVRRNGQENRLGFIDKNGREAIPLHYYGKALLSGGMYKYAELSYFSEGVAAVMNRDGKFGYIDKTGDTVISFDYDSASAFESNEAFVIKEKVMMKINIENKVVVSYPYGDAIFINDDLTGVVRDGKLGYFNNKGDLVIPFKYDYNPNCIDSRFSDGLSAVIEDGKSGYIDKSGKKVISLVNKYTSLRSFKNGYAIVSIGSSDNKRYGFIDLEGNEVVSPDYTKVYGQKGNLVLAVKNGMCGYLDLTNRVFTPTIYEDILYIEKNIIIAKKEGKYGILDINWNEVTPFIYNKLRKFKNGYAAAEREGKWGYITENGSTVVPFEYDEGGDFSDNAAIVKKGDVVGILRFTECG